MADEPDRSDEEAGGAEAAVKPEFPVQSELEWAAEYRAWQDFQTRVVKPKHSPIDVPFVLCRAREMERAAALNRSHKRKAAPPPQPTLLDRTAMSQSQYMDILSVPHKYNTSACKKHKKKKCPCKCRLGPCPPRLVQMAVPSKRLVYYTWRDHQYSLPPDAIVRFDKILSGDNEGLEPREARYYFKQMAKRERKKRRKRRAARRRKCKIRKGKIQDFSTKWHDLEADCMAEAICSYIGKEPLFALNYNQMMLSNEIVKYFHLRKKGAVPKRTTKNMRHRTLIEFADKVAKWLDGMAHFIDMQPLDATELQLMMAAPSLEELLMEEEEYEEELTEGEESEAEREAELEAEREAEREAEQEAEEEAEREAERVAEQQSAFEQVLFGEDGVIITGDDPELDKLMLDDLFGGTSVQDAFIAEKIHDRLDQYGEDSMMDMTMPGMSSYLDILERLIKILSNCEDEFLDSKVNVPGMPPNITYRDVLEKLKELRDGALDTSALATNPLEQTMTEWAVKNDPENVDEPIKEKIHETSTILMDYFRQVGAQSMKGQGLETVLEESEEGRASGKGEDDDNYEGLTEEEIAALKAKRLKEREDNENYEGLTEEEIAALKAKRLKEREDNENYEGLTEEEIAAIKAKKLREGQKGEGEDSENYEGLTEEEIAALKAKKLKDGRKGEERGEEGWSEGGEGPSDMEDLTEEAKLAILKKLEAEGDGKISGPDVEGLDELLRIIRGHKPSIVYDHAPDTICCLSLKIWAIWLLEIAQNAHNWTRWIGDIIRQVRQYAAIIRGDVTLPDGTKKILYKEEWRQFTKETEEKIVAWRQYSKHVKDLSDEIMETFHGKKVACCPKCLQDHMIKNVVTAHETLQALTEAINCAAYWQRCLDKIVEQTSKLTGIDLNDQSGAGESESSESVTTIDFEEIQSGRGATVRPLPPSSDSGSSVYEIEELEACHCPPRGSTPR